METTYGYLLSCDTFDKEIWSGETWPVTTTSLSGAGNGTEFTGPPSYVYLANGTTPVQPSPLVPAQEYSIQQQYDAAAILVDELMNDYDTSGGSQTTEDLSYAVWQIFDPSASAGLGSSDQAAVDSDLSNVFGDPNLLTDAAAVGITIYTPSPNVPPTVNGYTYGSAPQEFLGVGLLKVDTTTSVPESSSPPLLAFNLLALTAIGLLGRRARRAAK